METKTNKNEPCGARNFEEKEEKIIALTKTAVEKAYPIYWTGLNIVKDVINLLIKDTPAPSGSKIEKYNLAFLILINRSVQHIESVRVLAERGLYGDSFVLTRSLMSDIAMMQYLHYHPELLDLFLNEKQDDYQNNKDFKKAFNETAIEKDLVGKGLPSLTSSFQVLSKASHASSFGSQLYGSKGEKNSQYHLNYGPKFQPEKALIFLDIAVGSYYDLVNIILWHRYHAKEEIGNEDWEKVKVDLEKLEKDVKKFANITVSLVNIYYPKIEKQV